MFLYVFVNGTVVSPILTRIGTISPWGFPVRKSSPERDKLNYWYILKKLMSWLLYQLMDIWGCVKIRVWIGPRWSRRMDRSGSPVFWYGSGYGSGVWIGGMDRPVGSGYGSGCIFWLAAIYCWYKLISIIGNRHALACFASRAGHRNHNRHLSRSCDMIPWPHDFYVAKKKIL